MRDLMFQLMRGIAELTRDFGAHRWEREEEPIGSLAEGSVEEDEGAEEAMAFEMVEEFAGVAEDKKREEDSTDSIATVLEEV